MNQLANERQHAKRPFSLGIRWQEHVARVSGGMWQKHLTQQECGQLKMLANTLGSRTNEVIVWAVENWINFARQAQSEAGLSAFPYEPRIGFLLMHCDVAVNRMHTIAKAKEIESDRFEAAFREQAARETKKAEEGTALAARNAEDVEDMLARFAAAGERRPEIKYSQQGEVVYQATKQEIADLLSQLHKIESE